MFPLFTNTNPSTQILTFKNNYKNVIFVFCYILILLSFGDEPISGREKRGSQDKGEKPQKKNHWKS